MATPTIKFECQHCGREFKHAYTRCPSKDCPSNIALLEKYRAGKYNFRPPPVFTGNWTEMDWVLEIDSQKGWTE